MLLLNAGCRGWLSASMSGGIPGIPNYRMPYLIGCQKKDKDLSLCFAPCQLMIISCQAGPDSCKKGIALAQMDILESLCLCFE